MPSPRRKTTRDAMSERASQVDPYEEQLNAAGRQTNPWLIATIILAIALIGAIAFALISNNDSATTNEDQQENAISQNDASDRIMNFINTVYGPQIGESTFVGIREMNGMYEVTVSVNDPESGNPVNQVVFMTTDGELFIPQAINIDDALEQFRAYQQQQQTPPTTTSTATSSPSNATSSDEEATDSIEIETEN